MSDSQDDAQKTEEPTPRKLEQARQKGQIAQSREVSSFAVLLGLAFTVGVMGPFMVSGIHETLAALMEKSGVIPIDQRSAGTVLSDTFLDVLLWLSPMFVLFIVLALAANFSQAGILFTTEPITPKLEKISPLAGVKRLFSLKSLVEFLKGVFKLLIVGTIAYTLLAPEFDRLEALMQMEVIEVLREIQVLVLRMMIGVVAIMALIAAIDYAYQRFEYLKQMRMSRQEIRDEYKQSEGDPQIKARLRQIRTERARNRMMAAVPHADVVVTNPSHYAVALSYDSEAMAAPKLVAKGADLVAFRIRDVANENGVPIVENPPLARALFAGVDIDQQIPEEHYKAVAQVISYVYGLKGRRERS
ncbi:MAG: flagellar biosynthesis protein FlhB [Alphaproteobacteria bacterium]|nr:flagellar biosynthesis protein FlhB [Alphaproteobacteria bacterium]